MKIRRKDCEDSQDTNELIAMALTEDLAKWLKNWLGQSDPIGQNTKAALYHVITERLKKGVEI